MKLTCTIIILHLVVGQKFSHFLVMSRHDYVKHGCKPKRCEPHHEKKQQIFAFAKTKAQISFAVIATPIVQFLFFLNPKFQASSLLLRLYRLVCVKEDQFSRITARVFSRELPLS